MYSPIVAVESLWKVHPFSTWYLRPTTSYAIIHFWPRHQVPVMLDVFACKAGILFSQMMVTENLRVKIYSAKKRKVIITG